MPTSPDPPNAPAGSGLTDAEARTRLDALGERGELPTSRSYKSIVRANTLTLFNRIGMSPLPPREAAEPST